MSVLIKNMKKLPKDCPFCPMAHWNKLDRITGCEVVVGKRYVDETDDEFWKSDKRPSWCPLVEVPTADARQNVHGCWEYSLANDETFCSECHYVIAKGEEYPIYNFCPNCNADMRGRTIEQ